MTRETVDLKPLYLSEDEALALLEVCVMSPIETTPLQEQTLLKITNLTRRFLRSEQDRDAMEAERAEPFLLPSLCVALCVWSDSRNNLLVCP